MGLKKMLIINGSPRKKGNIQQMLEVAEKKAKELGYIVEKVWVYDKNIAPCKGCMSCKATGICWIEDDIVGIREGLMTADLVVVGAPSYFANVPGALKNIMDRLVAIVMDDNTSYIPKPKLSPKQRYILMTACTTPAPFSWIAGQSTGCLKAMNEFFHISGMKCQGKITYAGTRNKKGLPNKLLLKIERTIEKNK